MCIRDRFSSLWNSSPVCTHTCCAHMNSIWIHKVYLWKFCLGSRPEPKWHHGGSEQMMTSWNWMEVNLNVDSPLCETLLLSANWGRMHNHDDHHSIMGLAYNVHWCIRVFSVNKVCVENGHWQGHVKDFLSLFPWTCQYSSGPKPATTGVVDQQ